jgi:hypothetical protein
MTMAPTSAADDASRDGPGGRSESSADVECAPHGPVSPRHIAFNLGPALVRRCPTIAARDGTNRLWQWRVVCGVITPSSEPRNEP